MNSVACPEHPGDDVGAAMTGCLVTATRVEDQMSNDFRFVGSEATLEALVTSFSATALAGATMCLLTAIGILQLPPSRCSAIGGDILPGHYGTREAAEDLRRLSSFVLGALCCIAFLAHWESEIEPGTDRLQRLVFVL
eukprot:CAMPEP_0117555286 /NCGR_PEP_ID=MMETSP0784-20121206/51197_1 /TAXON_ID=39447 /ORGANISM="" /LENGTH=137 /DNA_ID=CAMNT_0005352489 /DNA_START=54 /DNA_END=467 /DNA_ORIENTATION=+